MLCAGGTPESSELPHTSVHVSDQEFSGTAQDIQVKDLEPWLSATIALCSHSRVASRVANPGHASASMSYHVRHLVLLYLVCGSLLEHQLCYCLWLCIFLGCLDLSIDGCHLLCSLSHLHGSRSISAFSLRSCGSATMKALQ